MFKNFHNIYDKTLFIILIVPRKYIYFTENNIINKRRKMSPMFVVYFEINEL